MVYVYIYVCVYIYIYTIVPLDWQIINSSDNFCTFCNERSDRAGSKAAWLLPVRQETG